ncbi:hypothetical protein MRY82_07010 [bacterium]|nr:hypothetical protein [bacterium]
MKLSSNIKVGVKNTLDHIVQDQDLAINWGNDLHVLSTPVLLWLSEKASMKGIDLLEDQMSVGYGHNSFHLAPSIKGSKIVIESTLKEVEGNKLTFEVLAHDREKIVLKGIHTRYILSREKFVNKIKNMEQR